MGVWLGKIPVISGDIRRSVDLRHPYKQPCSVSIWPSSQNTNTRCCYSNYLVATALYISDKMPIVESLLDAKTVQATLERISRLAPESKGQWGKMDVSQMLAHCALALEAALGDIKPPRRWLGYIFGPFMRKQLISSYTVGKNAPTADFLHIVDARNFAQEKARLELLMKRFVREGEKGITTHPHSFLGKLTPQEWGSHAYFHLDYHLKQFGA